MSERCVYCGGYHGEWQVCKKPTVIERFFDGQETKSTEAGVFLRPVGSSDSNPFPAPTVPSETEPKPRVPEEVVTSNVDWYDRNVRTPRTLGYDPESKPPSIAAIELASVEWLRDMHGHTKWRKRARYAGALVWKLVRIMRYEGLLDDAPGYSTIPKFVRREIER